MTRLSVGVIGHVDHGKTALVRALTGMETDRLPEEKRRGISIALGFAHLTAGDATIDLIDMPGHERFVRTMVAGATGIKAVLLVVAANEGLKPQTREHVDIAGLLGLRRALIAVSKTDLVSPAEANRVGRDATELLHRAGLQSCGPVLTSAYRGEGIAALRATLAELAAHLSDPATDGVPFLPIDRVFSVAGHGTVVTGTLRGGPLAPGDALELLPDRRPVRVRALQVHGSRVAAAFPGQRVAVNLRYVGAAEVSRGAALAPVGALPPSPWLTVWLRVVEDAPSLPTGAAVQALLGTAEVPARVRLLDRETLDPGDTAPAQIRLTRPVSITAREHVILRLASPARTVAGGMVIEAETVRHRRHAPALLERLTALARLDCTGVIAREVEGSGGAGVSLQHLSRLAGLAPAKVAAALQALPIVVGRKGVVVAREAFEAAGNHVVAGLQLRGMTREALAAEFPALGPAVLDEVLARLIASGTVRLAGGVFDVPRPKQEASRARDEAAVARELEQALRRGGLTPPDAGTLAPGHTARRMLERLIREGLVVRAHDSGQKRDVLFHRDATGDAQRRLRPLLGAPPGLLVSEIGAALGISRKFSVPLLEHLDRIGFTRRLGERRVLATPREAP